jgi:hypothetical protein
VTVGPSIVLQCKCNTHGRGEKGGGESERENRGWEGNQSNKVHFKVIAAYRLERDTVQ